jgi:hypothetical protein
VLVVQDLIAALSDRGVDYVIVGGMAAPSSRLWLLCGGSKPGSSRCSPSALTWLGADDTGIDSRRTVF